MKSIVFALLLTAVSLNASAVQLICNSPEKDLSSGKSLTVYRYNSDGGTMERFAYNATQKGYYLFGSLENLEFVDNLHQMFPLRRIVTAKANGETVLTATWVNGNSDFKATIFGEDGKVFSCFGK